MHANQIRNFRSNYETERPLDAIPEERPATPFAPSTPAFRMTLQSRGRLVSYERAPHGGQDDLGHVMAATDAARTIMEASWSVVSVAVDVQGDGFAFRVFATAPKPDGLLDAIFDGVQCALGGYAKVDRLRIEWETP